MAAGIDPNIASIIPSSSSPILLNSTYSMITNASVANQSSLVNANSPLLDEPTVENWCFNLVSIFSDGINMIKFSF